MSVRDADWWTTFTERLQDEPLSRLASIFGADPEELEQALAEASVGQAVTE